MYESNLIAGSTVFKALIQARVLKSLSISTQNICTPFAPVQSENNRKVVLRLDKSDY